MQRSQHTDTVKRLPTKLPQELQTKNQHPFGLILFYLAVLAKNINPVYANLLASKTEEIFTDMEFGGTLGLIHAWIRIHLKRNGFATTSDSAFHEELGIVAGYLPAAKTIINTLRSEWLDDAIPIQNLPFNYC